MDNKELKPITIFKADFHPATGEIVCYFDPKIGIIDLDVISSEVNSQIRTKEIELTLSLHEKIDELLKKENK